MKPEEIGRSYDQIAARWNDSSFDRQNGIEAHRKALSYVNESCWTLDVGCGCNGRFFELFKSQGFQVEGIDVSEEMVRLARRQHPDINIHQADISTWALPRKYGLISAWDSIWHVPLAQQEAVLAKLCEGLSPNGVFILTIGGLDEPAEEENSHMGVTIAYSTLGIEGTKKVLEENGCICRHQEFDQAPEKHFYLIVQKQTAC